MKEVKTTEYRISIKEFQEKFGITKTISQISYWGSRCEKDGDKDKYIEVETEEEQ